MADIRDHFRHPVYKVLRMVGLALMRTVVRWRVVGREQVPRTGALVLACNHIHNFDPIVLGASTPRFVHFMAKEELFRIGPLSRLIRFLGAFPIRRGIGDRAAIKHALAVTEQQQCLVVFPEGHRSKTGALGPGLPGVAMIAKRAACPIVPVSIIGPYGFRKRLTVRFGEPVLPDEAVTNQDLLNNLMGRIQRLLDEGHPQ